jgi:hypothetical protein
MRLFSISLILIAMAIISFNLTKEECYIEYDNLVNTSNKIY